MNVMKRLSVSCLLLLATLLFGAAVQAAQIEINESCNLADAIVAANTDTAVGGCPAGNGADTITLGTDITLAAKLPAISSDITVLGANHTISGDDKFNIFEVNDGALTVSQLTMIGGKAVYGGAIFGSNATLSITDSVLRGNAAEQSAAAVFAQWGTLTVSGSTFESNEALGAAAAIGILEAQVSISDSTFRDNRANFNGAIGNMGGDVTIRRSIFSDHQVEGQGGVIGTEDGSLQLIESEIVHASALTGGAIYNETGALTVSNSIIRNNSASAGGGAIYNRDGTVAISGSVISENSAAQKGGAIYSEGGELTVSDSTLEDNVAEASGGAIFNDLQSKLNVNNSRFALNQGLLGGAITNNNSEATVTNSVFNSNRSSNWGGAVVNFGEASLSISGSSFSRNYSEHGGGAIAANNGELFIEDSYFGENSAEVSGGTIVGVSSAQIVVKNSTLHGNSTPGFGGGFFLLQNSSASLTHLTIANNEAGEGGGIMKNSEGELNLHGSILSGNTGGDCSLFEAVVLEGNSGNLISDGSCYSAFNGEANLAELFIPDDGSPAYYPLLPGSPLIDAVDCDAGIISDQIGNVRPQGELCDIGAIEYISESETSGE